MSAEHMKLAVCTLCIGEIAEEFSKYSFPAFKKYAQRIGADFIVFDTPKVNYTDSEHINTLKFEKYQIHDVLDEMGYDRAAFFDVDILITPHAPSIFDHVPYKAIGGVFEDIGFDEKDRRQIIVECQEILGDVDWEEGFLNSGVFVVSKIHKDVFKMIWDHGIFDDPVHKYEQTNTQWYMRKFCLEQGDPEIEVINIDYKWNFTGPMRVYYGPFREEAYVIHYAGRGLFHGISRVEQMRKDYKKLYGPM